MLSLSWTLHVYFYIVNGADIFHCTQLLRICDFSVWRFCDILCYFKEWSIMRMHA